MTVENIDQLIDEIFSKGNFLYAVLSSPRTKNTEYGSKVSIRPLKDAFQLTFYRKEKAFHKNMPFEECSKAVKQALHEFKQALFCTSMCDYHVLIDKNQKATILKKPPTRTYTQTSHNRQKQYLLQEGEAVPFLVELGIMDRYGRVLPKKRDKFKQLNRFLEIIADVLPEEDVLHIIDFGCGKAYLTFALYDFLVRVKQRKVSIQGLDLKEDVVAFCNQLAKKMQFDGLHFSLGDIQHYKPLDKIDLVISLHACDTATDAALAQAVRWDAQVILCVPCCQHELFQQVECVDLAPLLRHGILKERFAALATDAARAQLLEIAGYQTQVMEFIDLEHTPKNLLIRGIKRKQKQGVGKLRQEYLAFKEALHIRPSLEAMAKISLG